MAEAERHQEIVRAQEGKVSFLQAPDPGLVTASRTVAQTLPCPPARIKHTEPHRWSPR